VHCGADFSLFSFWLLQLRGTAMALCPHLDDLLELRHHAHTLGLASHHPVNSILSGLYLSGFRGQGMDFEEVREYREGDEIRYMDWRVTARTGIGYLKVFREERQRSVILCVDSASSMHFGTRGTFKSVQAARAAALLGWAASSNHDRVGGIIFGQTQGLHYFRPGRERRMLWRFLRTLTQPCDSAHPHPQQALLEALDKLWHGAPTGALIFIIADLNRDSTGLEQRLGRLRQRHEVVMIPIDDPADYIIPNMGRVIFTAADGQRLELDTDSHEGQQQYQAHWHQRRAHLILMCKRLGIDLFALNTTEDVHLSLTNGLRRRHARRHA
jgi:uncharacterized protein (DUF58 family)